MDERLLGSLKEKVNRYESLIEKLYIQRESIEQKIVALEGMLNSYRAVYQAEAGKTEPANTATITKRLTVAEAASLILREKEDPQSASEIARQIIKRRLAKLSSKNATSTVISVMRRKPEMFDALGDGLYMVKTE